MVLLELLIGCAQKHTGGRVHAHVQYGVRTIGAGDLTECVCAVTVGLHYYTLCPKQDF